MNRFLPILVGCISPLVCTKAQTATPPNIIYILADDLGYGDLGCYGQQRFSTPNIDKLAAEGMRFTQHYSGSTVSAPSRSTLMTGLHTGHTPIRGNKELPTEGQTPLPDSIITLPKILQQAGYVTGAFGKWGLGMPGTTGDPNLQGFDEFYGYNCQRMAHRYYPTHLWHNDEKVVLTGNADGQRGDYAPDLIHDKLLEFISTNNKQPFFAYVPIIQPHAELLVPEDEIWRSVVGRYDEIPFVAKSNGAEYGSSDFNISAYSSQPQPRATFVAMVMRIDKYVGDIMALLSEFGLEENTIIIFSSDNGPHMEGGADPQFFNSNGDFRGCKRDLYEGGIRVPMITRWKSHIAESTTSEHISAFWDVLPTLAEVAGAETPEKTDGISFLPTLLGNNESQPQHDYLYWQFNDMGGRRAVLYKNWKAVQYNVFNDVNAPIQLYNMSSDVAENNNVATQHPDVVAQIKRIMDSSITPNEIYPFVPATK